MNTGGPYGCILSSFEKGIYSALIGSRYGNKMDAFNAS